MREKKKEYLKQYLLQEAKISRLQTMAELNPEKKGEYDRLIQGAINLRREIEEKIAAVDGGILSELLFQKYVFGRTLDDISCILNYSPRHIERLHIKALEKFNM
ncbi:MAG: hypothetical protein ACOYJS_03235 [Acutalibacteraceae bacterium]|jgi:hypothetical protein